MFKHMKKPPKIIKGCVFGQQRRQVHRSQAATAFSPAPSNSSNSVAFNVEERQERQERSPVTVALL